MGFLHWINKHTGEHIYTYNAYHWHSIIHSFTHPHVRKHTHAYIHSHTHTIAHVCTCVYICCIIKIGCSHRPRRPCQGILYVTHVVKCGSQQNLQLTTTRLFGPLQTQTRWIVFVIYVQFKKNVQRNHHNQRTSNYKKNKTVR